MGKFRFIVRSAQGKTRRGVVTDVSLKAARNRLQESGFQVVELYEEADLIVHEAPRPGGGGLKPKRAEIIEFETSFSERAGEWLEKWLLRKEMAAVLLALGMVAMVVSWVNAPKKEPPPELEYKLYTIEVAVDLAQLEGSKLQVVLPDLPFKKVADAEIKTGSQTVSFEIEAAEQPTKVEVCLLEFDGKVVGADSGTLTAQGGKEGALGSNHVLSPAKENPDH